MAGRSKVGECSTGAVVVAQFNTFRYCGNLCEEVDQVVSFNLALLLIQEAVDLAAICSIQESGEKDKETRLPIHSYGDTLLLFYKHLDLYRAILSLPYFHICRHVVMLQDVFFLSLVNSTSPRR